MWDGCAGVKYEQYWREGESLGEARLEWLKFLGGFFEVEPEVSSCAELFDLFYQVLGKALEGAELCKSFEPDRVEGTVNVVG